MTDSHAEAEAVSVECRVMDHVYVLGSFSRGVSMLTQQMRAFNLVWALFETGQLSATSKVAVVGAGLAGLTAASALTDKGCKVILFDSADEPMHIQAHSKLRFVHPNIHLWPQEKALQETTVMPCLNWKADAAHDVRDEILHQWSNFKRRVDTRFGSTVGVVSNEYGKPIVVCTRPKFKREPTDCVLLAVGFGIEDLQYSHPYWEPDGLEYSVATNTKRVWIVSGCGDGALVDVLRLRIKDFNYSEAIRSVLQPTPARVAEQVLSIEKQGNQFLDASARGDYLFTAYENLVAEIPTGKKRAFSARLRSDTLVHLVCPHSTPFAAPSMPVNRFLIASLFAFDDERGLRYQQGKCYPDNITMVGDGYSVKLMETPASVPAIHCNRVLFRHGPIPVVGNVLHETAVSNMRQRNATLFGPTRMALDKLWPAGFYTDRKFVARPRKPLPVARPIGSRSGLIPNRISHTLYCGAPIRTVSGHAFVTLGCFVHLPGGEVGALSTAHGLTPSGKLEVGDEIVSGDAGQFRVGRVHSIVQTVSNGRNAVDAAVTVLSPETKYISGFPPHYRLPPLSDVRSHKLGERVWKVGAASGLTRGKISFESLSFLLPLSGANVLFEDAIGILGNRFAAPGDSGAVIVGNDGAPLGMLFALTSGSESIAFACRMDTICSALSCTVMTGESRRLR